MEISSASIPSGVISCRTGYARGNGKTHYHVTDFAELTCSRVDAYTFEFTTVNGTRLTAGSRLSGVQQCLANAAFNKNDHVHITGCGVNVIAIMCGTEWAIAMVISPVDGESPFCLSDLERLLK